MALSIGELAGYLTLDDSKFEQGLKGAHSKFEATGAKLKSAGKKLGIAAGAAAGAAIAAGIAANIADGKANDKLAAQLGLTEKESQRIGKVAGSLYRDAYGDSLGEVNVAVGAVMSSIKGMSNASGKDLERVTAKAIDFAGIFEVDVNRAAQIAGQAISTGLAKNADEAFDLIVAASQKVPAALREDVLDAADEYGQFFAGLGYDGQQAFAMLVDASEKGMYGIDKTGDAIKEFTIRSTDMSTASKDAYEAIGLGAGEMANKILAGGDTAQAATRKIIDGILGIKDPAKQGEVAIALFGTPLEDLNAQEIPKFLKSMRGTSKSMDDAAGAATRAGDDFNDNFATRMTGWKNTAKSFVQQGLMAIVAGFEAGGRAGEGWRGELSELGAFIKSPLLPILKDVGRFVLDNAAAFVTAGLAVAALVVGLKIYRTILAVVTGVQMIATAATTGYALATTTLGSACLGTRIGLAALAVQAAVTTAAQKAATVATKAWTLAQLALNLAMRMNPIGLVITALVALGAGLVLAYKKSETFRRIVDAAFRAVKVAATFAFDWIKKNWPLLLAIIAGPIGLATLAVVKNWDKITAVTKKMVDGISSGFRWLWNKAIQPVLRFIVDGLGKLMIMWGKMLQALGKVPGFGWAKAAGDKMVGAGRKAQGLARNIRKIPDRDVQINVDTSAALAKIGVFKSTLDGIDNRFMLLQAKSGATPGRAAGGPVKAGQPYEVGERGKELFVPEANGRIVPNHALRDLFAGATAPLPQRAIQPQVPSPRTAGSSAGGATINQTINMPTTTTEQAAFAGAGGRVLAELAATGV